MKKIVRISFIISFLIFSFQVKSQNSIRLFLNTPCVTTDEPENKYDVDNQFLVMPNPTHGEFSLEFEAIPIGQTTEITISNIQGSIIWQRKINLEDKYCFINLSSACDGIYIVTVNIGELISHRKLIIY